MPSWSWAAGWNSWPTPHAEASAGAASWRQGEEEGQECWQWQQQPQADEEGQWHRGHWQEEHTWQEAEESTWGDAGAAGTAAPQEDDAECEAPGPAVPCTDPMAAWRGLRQPYNKRFTNRAKLVSNFERRFQGGWVEPLTINSADCKTNHFDTKGVD